MARMRSLDRGSQNVGVHPSEVDGYYQLIMTSGGERYLHLTTFGSDSRQSAPKSSQSIQFSQQMAQQLVDVLRAAFPGVH